MAKTIQELTVDECLELLGARGVGRVGLATSTGQHIVPVNYAMYGDDTIVFRTTPYSDLGSHGSHAEVAFEVDDIDFEEQEGWSVVANGRLEIVEDPDEVADIRRSADPGPWAIGQRNLMFKLTWLNMTGRRIGG